jgi:hypothetical protein
LLTVNAATGALPETPASVNVTDAAPAPAAAQSKAATAPMAWSFHIRNDIFCSVNSAAQR